MKIFYITANVYKAKMQNYITVRKPYEFYFYLSCLASTFHTSCLQSEGKSKNLIMDHGSEAHCSATVVHVNSCLIPGLSQVYNPFNVTLTQLKH